MTTATECRCGQPTRDDAYFCGNCSHRFATALGDVPWINDELDTTITRQRAAPITGSAPSAERGLPWHDKASETRRHLHALLVSWVRFCTEENIRGIPAWHPVDRLPSLSRWLMHAVHGLSLHDIGPEAVDEITDAVADCERIVFWKRRARVYLGPCGQPVGADDDNLEPCPGDVYADEGAAVGYCEECEGAVTVVIRRAELEQQLDDRLCTAAEIARLATYLGLHVDRDRVRTRVHYWHRHKRITQRSRDDAGSPMFRYGEVRVMLSKEFGHAEARGA